MLLRNPSAFAFLLAAVGIGLVAYYGEQLRTLPAWSETEIEQSVELNLQLELQRRGPHLQPSSERLERLRETLRAEVVAEVGRERAELERWVGAGLLMIVLGVGQWLAGFWLRRPRAH
jgi:hypothetical protein